MDLKESLKWSEHSSTAVEVMNTTGLPAATASDIFANSRSSPLIIVTAGAAITVKPKASASLTESTSLLVVLMKPSLVMPPPRRSSFMSMPTFA